jgi:hypothetical protein
MATADEMRRLDERQLGPVLQDQVDLVPVALAVLDTRTAA